MRKTAPAFLELEKQILKKELTKKEIANQLRMSPSTLSQKLTGKVEFTLKEIKYLHQLFPDISIEILFSLDDS